MASKWLLLLLILAFVIASCNAGKIAVYWGQHSVSDEGSLNETCAPKPVNDYHYVNIAFLEKFGNGTELKLNLDNHPTKISEEIKYCQSRGIKVLLSIRGSAEGNLTSVEDARDVATKIWNQFLGGNSSMSERPFGGDAVLDGVDFSITGVINPYWANLAAYLSEYSQPNNTVYLTAPPDCSFPDAYLDETLQTVRFDIVWIQFYDNSPCEYNGSIKNLISAWNTWTRDINATYFFLGLPASNSSEAASGGFIPVDVLNNQLLPQIKTSPKYGGIMLWDRYFDRQTNYSQSINHGCWS